MRSWFHGRFQPSDRSGAAACADGSPSASCPRRPRITCPHSRRSAYMFYINRTSADGLTGWLPQVRRYFIEQRVRGAARAAFTALKRNIEFNASHTPLNLPANDLKR